MKKAIIVGGGISGLALAYYLKDQYEITLIEKQNRLGGWIQTIQKEGFLFELGPRGVRPAPTTLALAKELGLDPLFGSEDAKKRYLAYGGKLKTVSPWLMIKGGLLQGVFRDLFIKPRPCEDETIKSFWIRHFGPRFTQQFVDPITRGIFGGDYKTLSAKSCLPKLWEIDQTKGSLILGRKKSHRGLYAFADGMESLIQALSHTPMDLYLNTEVTDIKPGVVTCLDQQFQGDVVIVTTPPYTLERFFNLGDPHHYVTLSVVNCGWHQSVLKKTGFGFLVPSTENEEIMGMTFDHSIFPSQLGKTRLTAMIKNERSEEELKQITYDALDRFCDIQTPPDVLHLSCAKNAITQYGVGHSKWLEHVRKELPKGVYVLGSGYDGVGVNDCVVSAASLATSLKQL